MNYCVIFYADDSIYSLYSLYLIAGCIIFMVALLILFEVFQIYTQGRKYFRDWTNYIDIILYVSSIIFASSLSEYCLCVSDDKWQFGIIATFLSWIDFLLFIRILPGGMFKYASIATKKM